MANSKLLAALFVFSTLLSAIPLGYSADAGYVVGQWKWLGQCKSIEECKKECVAAGYADEFTDLSDFALMPDVEKPVDVCGCPEEYVSDPASEPLVGMHDGDKTQKQELGISAAVEAEWVMLGECESIEKCKKNCIAAGYGDESTDLSKFQLMPDIDKPVDICSCPNQKAPSPSNYVAKRALGAKVAMSPKLARSPRQSKPGVVHLYSR